MLNRTNILTALILGVGAVAFANSGCELISSVDRTKIPGGSGGSATGGGTNPTGGGTTNPTGGGTTANGGGGSGGTPNGGGGSGGTPANGGGGAGQGGTGGGCTAAGMCPDPGQCKQATCDSGQCGSKAVADGTVCPTGGCKGGSCVPLCQDGVKDGDETGIDCGGSCLSCNYDACTTGATCASNTCLNNNLLVNPGTFCFPAHCNNHVKDAGEAGTDCGGAACPLCDAGSSCTGNGDCKSSICLGSPATCQ